MLLPLVLIDANKHGSLKSLGPWITYWRRVPPLIRNSHFGLCMSIYHISVLNIFVLFCFSAVSPPNYSMQKCALLNTHMALLTGSDHVTHFQPWNVRESLLVGLRKMSVFLIKGTIVAGSSFLQQPFCHLEGKAKKITEVSVQTDISCWNQCQQPPTFRHLAAWEK